MGEARGQAGIDIAATAWRAQLSFPGTGRPGLPRHVRLPHGHAPAQSLNIIHFEVDRRRCGRCSTRCAPKGESRSAISKPGASCRPTACASPDPRSPTPPTRPLSIARQIGYPVVLKIASPGYPAQDRCRRGQGRLAQRRGSARCFRADGLPRPALRARGARIWGCLVQEMVPAGGLEVLVGMNRDPQFGPLVTFGLGGIYVETLKDVTFRVAPFSSQEADEMLSEIRAHALLDGVRGKPPWIKLPSSTRCCASASLFRISPRSSSWISTP